MRDSHSGGLFRSACGGQVATSFSGSPFSIGRRSERPSPVAFCSRTQGLFEANAYRLFYGQEPHTKPQKLFPLELRSKT
jgi:hypothetical protein